MTREQLLKYIKGETSESDRMEVYRWIESSPECRNDYEQLRKMYDALLCNDKTSVIESGIPQRNSYRTWKIFSSVASVVIAFIAIGLSLMRYTSIDETSLYAMEPRSIHVPVGQRAEVTLGDGTIVWLNSNSTLDVLPYGDHGQRRVKLSGEAYFQVASDSLHPFIVIAPNHEISVLGTTFDVTAYREGGDDFSVKLFEGKVSVTDTHSGKDITMKKGSRLDVTSDGFLLTELSEAESTVWWINGIYHFDDTEYSEIFQRLEERYGVTIVVRNPRVNHYRCTSKFRMEDGLMQVVRSIQHIHHFDYEWDDTERKLTIR